MPNQVVADAVLAVPIALAVSVALIMAHPKPRYEERRTTSVLKVAIVGALLIVEAALVTWF